MIREKIIVKGSETCKALITCSGAIVLFSSLLQTSLDSEEIKLINSARRKNMISIFLQIKIAHHAKNCQGHYYKIGTEVSVV